MSCAHCEGWFGVRTDLRDEDDLSILGATIVGRCVIYAPLLDDATPCAEGLIVRLPDGHELALYWAKPSRAFMLVPVHSRARADG